MNQTAEETQYCFYILRCSDQEFYYGSSSDLAQSLFDHAFGAVEETCDRRPLELVYFEETSSLASALNLRVKFISGEISKEIRDKILELFSKDQCQELNARAQLVFALSLL